MNPFDRVHRTFAFKRILGSVEKAWGRFLNESYLRRTYLRGRLQSFASERGKNGTGIVSPVLDKRKGGSIRVTIAPRKSLLSEVGFHRLLISSEKLKGQEFYIPDP